MMNKIGSHPTELEIISVNIPEKMPISKIQNQFKSETISTQTKTVVRI